MAKTETLSPAPVIRLGYSTQRRHRAYGWADWHHGFFVLYPLVLILINSFNTATIAEPPYMD